MLLKRIFAIAAFGYLASGITEDPDKVTLTDASHTKERPNLVGYDFSEEEKASMEEPGKQESYEFNADVSRLMDIIINSLYTKKDVFIREMVSNASDALDKMRFISVQEPETLGNTPELEIKIDFDDKEKTISITDTGIGMTKAELVKNLGTVAKSGTTSFLEAMGQGENMSLIGQFGVGFYSAFLVANKVQVTSKSNDDEQYIWTSTADSKFSINKDPRGDTLGRGSRVTLFLKDDATDYIEQEKLKNLVKKYSEFINYPISLYTSKEVSEEVPLEEPVAGVEKVVGDESEENEDDVTVKDDGENADKTSSDTDDIMDEEDRLDEIDARPTTKTVKRQAWEWDLINDVKAIWMREKASITEQEYHGFYKTITKDSDNPLAYTHFSAEGEIEFKAILYIPSSANFDLYDNYYGQSSSLKLYVRRVLISDDFSDLMPKYLNFVRGIVDSDDLPLNVSREQLQQLKMLKVMSKKLIRKTLDMIRELVQEDEEEEEESSSSSGEDEENNEEEGDEVKEGDEDKKKSDEEEDEEKVTYLKFWKSFGKSIKLGVIEDTSNRMKLAKLLRFYSTNDPEKLTSLDEYISRMKDDQDTILYLPGDSKESILSSPILEKYMKMNYEVLVLDDPVDEYTTQHLTEYEKRKVKSIAKLDVKVLETKNKAEKKKLQKMKSYFMPLLNWIDPHCKEMFGTERVALSQKLVDAPLYLFTSEYGYSATMEKIQKAQAFSNSDKTPGYMLAKKTLEVNPAHPIIKQMLHEITTQSEEEMGTRGPHNETVEYFDLLVYAAMLQSGFTIDEPSKLAIPLEKLVKVGMGMTREEKAVPVEFSMSEDEEEEESESEKEADENEGLYKVGGGNPDNAEEQNEPEEADNNEAEEEEAVEEDQAPEEEEVQEQRPTDDL